MCLLIEMLDDGQIGLALLDTDGVYIESKVSPSGTEPTDLWRIADDWLEWHENQLKGEGRWPLRLNRMWGDL
jgi:hypothetical protein